MAPIFGSASSRKLSTRPHRIGWAVLIIVAVLAIALLVCEKLGWPFLRAPAERFMNTRLERTVRLDAPFKLHLLGGVKLDVGGLWISAPQGFDAPHLIDAKDVLLELRYTDLLKPDKTGPMRIKSLRVAQMDAVLVRNEDGSSSWQFRKNDAEPSRPFPTIETLVVRNGTALVRDPLTQSDLKVIFSTQEGASNSAPVSSVQTQGKFRQRSIQAELTTNGFLPIAAQHVDASPIISKGWVEYAGVHGEFDGVVSDIFGSQDIKGTFAVKGPSLGLLGDLFDITLPTTESFKLHGDIEKNNGVWLANVVSARVGESDLSGNFQYDPRPEKPFMQGELKGKRFVLADLAPAFGTKNEDGSDAKPRAGHAIPDRPFNFPSLNRMDAKIDVNLDYVDLGNAFSRPISPLKADLILDAGKLSLSNLYAHTAEGTLSGLISVDAHQLTEKMTDEKVIDERVDQKPIEPDVVPAWRIDVAWKDIDLEKWLQVSKERKEKARQKGKKDSPPAYVSGTLNGKTKLAGKGRSTAELMGSLDGDISLYINEGKISHLIIEVLGLDVAQGLGLLLRGDEPLPMQCAVMNLKAQHGIATPSVALIDTPVTLILFDGKIDLAQEKLNLRLIAKPKNVSPFTVRSPILVKGTFVNPDVSAEPGPIATKVLVAVGLAFINPLAAILPFIDTGSKDARSSTCSTALAEFNKASASKVSAKAADIKTR
jgi:uncharacterized protein involved in outer membrane biogenesis